MRLFLYVLLCVRTTFIAFVSTIKTKKSSNLWVEDCFCVCGHFFPSIFYFFTFEHELPTREYENNSCFFFCYVFVYAKSLDMETHRYIFTITIISVWPKTYLFRLFLLSTRMIERDFSDTVVFQMVALTISVYSNDIACMARYVCCCCCCCYCYTLRTMCVFADTKIIVSFVHWFLSRATTIMLTITITIISNPNVQCFCIFECMCANAINATIQVYQFFFLSFAIAAATLYYCCDNC